MNADALTRAAQRIEDLARDLGNAYRDLNAQLNAARGAAYQQGGPDAASDLANAFAATRVHEEIAGTLRAAGLDAILAVGITTPPVKDFAERWNDRVVRGELTTTRRWPPHTPAERERDLQAIPGYAPRDRGRGSLPKPTIRGRGDDE